MIYLDNSATTYPKPEQVKRAAARALSVFGANPGRGGHAMAQATAQALFDVRKKAAVFFGAPGPESVIFVKSCTEALNQVIFGCLKPGDRVLVSDLEHNAVTRPLCALEETGVQWAAFETCPGDDEKTLDSLRALLAQSPRLVVCTAASNVFGFRLPIGRIAALCHFYGAEICVDAAQAAGVLPIDMACDGIDYLCVPAHKGLYGTMGVGMLITAKGAGLRPMVYGGTGVNSQSARQPDDPPERFESGTLNVPGIVAMGAGIDFVSARGCRRIHRAEMALLGRLYQGLAAIKGIELYTPYPNMRDFVPVLSFNVAGQTSEEVADYLARQGTAVRAGLHCAPAAHKKMGTDDGTVRLSPSVFTTGEQVTVFLRQMARLAPRTR